MEKLLIKKKRVVLKKRIIRRAGLNLPPDTDYKDSGVWHQRMELRVNGVYMSVSGMMTGCGVGQIYGISNYCQGSSSPSKADLHKAFERVKNSGIGAIVATLGASYYKLEPKILALGFEFMSEYCNYQHGVDGKYKQKMYIIKL